VHGNKSLHALAVPNLTWVDVALRIDGDHVQTHELTAVLAHHAHITQYLAVPSIEEPDVVIRDVGNIQIALLLVGPKTAKIRYPMLPITPMRYLRYRLTKS